MNWHIVLSYDPDSGQLIWKEFPEDIENHKKKTNLLWFAKRRVGKPADKGHAKYVYVRFLGKVYDGHRIVWEMHYGPVPEGMVIDHINGNGRDNRLSNLRLATPSQNMRNTKMNRRNRSGYRGVMQAKSGAFIAQIAVNGKQCLIGAFGTAEEAYAAYTKKARELHGEFSGIHRDSE